MSVQRQDDKQPLDFIERKKTAKVSNAELSRRANVSLNTVKSFLAGSNSRETTVQALHEALDAYVSEQRVVNADPMAAVQKVGEKKTDPSWFEQQALQAIRMAESHLLQAADLRFDQKLPVDEVFLRRLELQIRGVRRFLEPV